MKKIILIAEDYDDARAYMTLILESSGYQVYEAANGEEAIKIAKDHHPDLILMDIAMPVMDGLTATRIIRKSETPISNIPIVAVTAFTNFSGQALAAGCNDVVNKPVDFDELETVIDKYLLQN